ncbi:MAG: hypothetical protein ACOYKE_10335, partial [Ferruginibacter sp.]
MKKGLLTLLLVVLVGEVFCQQIDKIFANLYTDSLKKGTYNYINIDGLLSNGRYLPLDSSHVNFESSGGKFYGNSLYLENDFSAISVTVKVQLKSNPQQQLQIVIPIKQWVDPTPLKS